MGGGIGPHFHPSHDVGAAGYLPPVEVRIVAEIIELMPDPERPIAIAA